MYHHSHSQHPGAQPQQRRTNRVPQFNKDYCGYHCGEGCEPYDVGGAESDATSTLVEENGAEAVGLSAPTQDRSEASMLPESYTANDAGVEQEDAHLQRNDPADMRDGSFPSPQVAWDLDDSLSYPQDFMTSGARSVRSFGSGSVGTVSPSVWVAEAGTWVPTDGYPQDVDYGVDRLPPEYYFVETPLRLSAQYEDCRGLPECSW